MLEIQNACKAQFLSPHSTYAVNLVFGIDYESMDLLFFNYKLAEETYYSTSYIADEREDGWFTTELYQFTSTKRSADFDITFDHRGHPLILEGIEFQPVERVDHQVLVEEEVDMPDTYREQKLPSDYEDVLKSSKDSHVQWTTKKHLYFVLCKGFRINNGEEVLATRISKQVLTQFTVKKCHMLPASMHGFAKIRVELGAFMGIQPVT
ncbi:unnamed protein product [Lactuca virosa]|uniref:Agglutinin domain-containing protein n=1 Tax=Lactuca virosa TaxID=75947 RepID=A0AAU9P4X3_9ASTR|nr:unnamed protein product [Lactuca virosa]